MGSELNLVKCLLFGCGGGFAKVSGEHEGVADFLNGLVEGLGEGVFEESLFGPGAESAGEDADEGFGFGRVEGLEEFCEVGDFGE